MRDLDLFKEINSKTKCVIQMTLTTYDEELCKEIEPNVSTTKERVEALKNIAWWGNTNSSLVNSDTAIYQRYIREYGNNYVANSVNNKKLMVVFHEFCERNGIVHDNEAIFNYLGLFEGKDISKQLSFFDEV